MPRPKKTAQEIAEMRRRILNAARELLEKEGIAGLSIRKIGKRLGVSHMVLYTYFENRNAVVETLKEQWLERLEAQRAQDLQEAKTGDVLVALRESLACFGRLAHKHPQIYRLAWVHHGADKLARERSQFTEGEIEHLVRLVALGIERGQCVDRDPHLAAAMALCIVNSPHMLYYSERLTDEALYAQLEPEALQAAMDYLTG
jgi:AcrR family transcriptional regulator